MPCHVTTPSPLAPYALTLNPHAPVKPRGSALILFVTPRPLPNQWYLLLIALQDYIPSPQTNISLLCTLCSHSYAPKKTFYSVTHSKIALGQTRLTWRFFQDRLMKKKMHLVGMSTQLILLSLGPWYHHPPGPGYHIVGDCRASHRTAARKLCRSSTIMTRAIHHLPASEGIDMFPMP
jgi:hypothetical protein